MRSSLRAAAPIAALMVSALALTACNQSDTISVAEYQKVVEENGRLKAELDGKSGLNDEAMREWMKANISFVVETARVYATRNNPQGPEAPAPGGPTIAGFVAAHDKLFDGAAPTLGGSAAPKKIRIAHFFDYNCTWCKSVAPTVKALSEKHPDVEIHFLDLPILKPSSRLAAQAGIAAFKQGKYNEYHQAVYALPNISEASLIDAAKKVGLDVTKFTADMTSPDVVDRVSATFNMGKELGVRGTPFFYIEGAPELVPGAPPIEWLDRLVEEARKKLS